MKELIIGITVVLAFHVGNIEAAQWMPLGEAEDRQLLRTNNSPEEGRIICTSKTRGNGQGIGKGGRRLGFLTKKGCKTIGGGDKVRWFTRENGDIMVLVDDEPAVQDDAQEEGEDYQAMYEEAWDAAAEAVQQLQDAQERHDAALQGQIDAALVGMVAESEVDRRVEAALEGMVDENTIQVHVNAAGIVPILVETAQAPIVDIDAWLSVERSLVSATKGACSGQAIGTEQARQTKCEDRRCGPRSERTDGGIGWSN